MWLGIFSWRKGEPEYDAFVKRYWLFLSEDIESICDSHHAEVHRYYDQIIQSHRERTGKPLYKYNWREAESLMQELEDFFWVWVEKDTPGYSTQRLRKERRSRKNRQRRKR